MIHPDLWLDYKVATHPFSQSPAKVNGRLSFMAIANGSFGFAVLRHS